MTSTFIQRAQPTTNDGLKRGDFWVELGTGAAVVHICLTTDPVPRFIEVAREKQAEVADVAGAVPAGGTGAAAGAWDTAANRNTAITTITEIKAQVNLILARLRTAGIIR